MGQDKGENNSDHARPVYLLNASGQRVFMVYPASHDKIIRNDLNQLMISP